MLLTILFIVIFALSMFEGFVIESTKWYKTKIKRETREFIVNVSLAFFIIGLLGIICSAVFIIASHVGVKPQAESLRIEYESLIERKEIVDSDFEDVSKSEVIKDVAEWNKRVTDAKFWSSNPWFSWFWDKRVVERYKYID